MVGKKLSFNFLLNDNFLDLTKFKAFTDDKYYVAKIIISVFDRVENIVRKGENAGYQHFLFSPHCFQKTFFSRSLKVGIVWKRQTAIFFLNWSELKALADDKINVT